MSDDVLQIDLHDMDEALYRIAYAGVQTKPVRGVDLVTRDGMATAIAALPEEPLSPEACLVADSEMRAVLARTAAQARSERSARPFFRVAIVRRLRDGRLLAGGFEVAREDAGEFLHGVDSAIGAASRAAKDALARLRLQTLP